MLKNEWWLFKENIYALLHNKRLSRAEFFFAMLMLINPFTSIFAVELITRECSANIATIFRFVVYSIMLIITMELIIRRLKDSFYGVKPIVLWLCIVVYLVWDKWGQLSKFIDLVWIVASLWGLCYIVLPHDYGDNHYGVEPLSEKLSNGIIRYKDCIYMDTFWRMQIPYLYWNQIFEFFYKSWIRDLFYYTGRINRENFIISIWGYAIPCMIPILLYFNVWSWGETKLLSTLISCSTTILYSWFGLMMLSLSVRRLHDSAHSALWLPILCIPVIGGYVLYLIFFKPSWISLEPYNKTA